MGDIADDYINRMINRSPRTAYGPITQCNFCGSTDVYWQKTKTGHVMHNRSDLSKHDCTPEPTADGFEDEPT